MDSPNIQKIIDTITEVFSVFDLSYLVSGIATLSLLCYEVSKHQLIDLSNLMGYWCFLLVPVGIYVCGLMSWTVGKTLRKVYLGWSKKRGGYKRDAKDVILKSIGSLQILEQPKECKSCDRINLMDYISYVWTELTKQTKGDTTLSDQLRSIRREWVMETVYEGLAFSSILLSFVAADVLVSALPTLKWYIYILIVALALLLAVVLLSTMLYKTTENGRAYARDLICTYITYIDKPVIVKDLAL